MFFFALFLPQKFTAEALSISFFEVEKCDTKNKMQIQNRRFYATFLANAKFPNDFSTVTTHLCHTYSSFFHSEIANCWDV